MWMLDTFNLEFSSFTLVRQPSGFMTDLWQKKCVFLKYKVTSEEIKRKYSPEKVQGKCHVSTILVNFYLIQFL